MKALWFLIAASLAILIWHAAYNSGQREQREFEALCETPGVRCLVTITPAYVAAHGEDIKVVPYAAYEWRDDDGGLR